ncbi:3'-5' exonuclease [Candidatus Woesearchaeota archaeon]|nr:MAG: 3'-5' exonuclease [Candidatus Woesearchaeota archaeon]
MGDVIVVDVETTGLDPRSSSIVSIGAVSFASPEKQFYGECRPFAGAVIDQEAYAVNGFSNAYFEENCVQSLESLLKQFFSWCEGVPGSLFAGQNVGQFDLAFLVEGAKRCEVSFPESVSRIWTVDLHSVAYTVMVKSGISPGSALSASRIYGFVGIPDEPRPHHALRGALWEAEAFSRLWYGRSLLANFAKYPLPRKYWRVFPARQA